MEPKHVARLATLHDRRRDRVAPATLNRDLSCLRKAVSWWRRQEWIHSDPTRELNRVPVAIDRTKALSREQVDSLWSVGVGLREKALWRLLYETAGRAEEVLCLDVGDLDMPNKRARIVQKGGDVEWIPLEVLDGAAPAPPAPRA